jgi:hypothetical protein
MAKIAEILNNVVSDSGVEISSLQPLLTNPVTGTGTTNYIPKFTGTSAIGNSIIYETGGLIGVGTTTPAEFVHLKTSSYATPLYVEYSGGTSAYIGLANSGGRAYLLSNNNDLVFATSSSATERMRITNGGNVGIGTSSPSFKLDIFTAQSIRVFGSSTGYTQGSIIFQSSTTDTPQARGLGVYAFNEGTDATWFYGTGYNAADTFVINRKAGVTYEASAAAPGESSNFFAITNTGNVGVGTTSPTNRLDIRSASGSDAFAFVSGGAGATKGGLYLGNNGGQYGSLWFDNATNDVVLRQNYNNGNLIFGTNFTERMRITSGGNVLVGTTSSNGGRLDVVSGAGLNTYFNSTASGVYLQIANNSTNLGYIGDGTTLISGGTSTDFSFRSQAAMLFATNGSTERMRITSGGDVGIGTTSPQTKLHVNGDITLGTTLLFSGTNLYPRLSRSTNDLYFSTNGAGEVMRIIDAGRVGIGTNNPQVRLSVQSAQNNTIAPANSVAKFVGGDAGIFVGTLAGTPNYGSYLQSMRESDALTFPMFLNPLGGNVGIGTNSPSERLDVNGRIQGERFRTTTAGDASFAAYYFLGDSDTGLFQPSNNSLAITTAGSERMRVNSSGDIGIGTSSQEARLHVQSDGGSTTSPNTALIVQANTATTILAGGGTAILFRGVSSGGNIQNYDQARIRTVGYATNNAHGFAIDVKPTAATPLTQALLIESNSSANFASSVSASSFVRYGGTSSQYLMADGSTSTLTNPVTGTGTANYIPKWTSSSAISNSTLYDNGSTVSIGLGSTTPSYTTAYGYPQFAVESNLFASSHVFTHNSTNGNYSFFALGKSKGTAAAPTIVENSETIGDIQFWAYDGTAYRNTAFIRNQIDGTPGAGDTPGRLVFATTNDGSSSATEKMRITSGGQLLVGVTSGINNGMVHAYAPSGNQAFTAQVANNAYSLFQGFNAAGSATFYVTGAGNIVGSGSISMSGSASIGSYLYLASEGTGSVIGDVSTGNYLRFIVSNTERMRITSSGNVGIGTTSPEAKLDVFGSSSDQIRLRTAASEYYRIGRNASTGYLDFWGSQSGYVGYTWSGVNGERMRLDSSGNLGLGVVPSAWNSPFTALQIKTASISSDNSNNASFVNNAYFDGTNWRYINSSTAQQYLQYLGQHIWLNSSSGTAGNAISFTQAMTLFSTGNLAVGGTSDTGEKLQITGRAVINANSAALNADILTVRGGGGSGNYGFKVEANNGADLFYTDNYTYNVIMGTTGGLVGIGTTSPTRLLDVNGVIRTQNAGSAGAPSIELGTSAQGNGLFYPTTNTIAISTNDTERMRITSGGELLINTTSDAGDYKLQVNGNGYFVNGGLAMKITGNDLIFTRTGAVYITAEGTSSSMILQTSNTTALTLTSSQNAEFAGSIKTAAPSGGTAAAWKLGSRISNTCGLPATYADFTSQFMNTNKVIEIEIGGVTVYVPTVTPGWC